jgi:PAS domain S-box-containing protein
MPDPANVLVVDDRSDKLLATETILAPLDVRLFKATSGKHALRLVLQHEFAVILLDVNMPEMDGFETAALIRSRTRSQHTPIIFLTAYSPEETHVAKGYSLGAVDYIFVPVVPEILRAKVGVFIDLHRTNGLFKRMFDDAPTGMMLLEGKRILRVNRAFCSMLDYASDELLALNYHRITHPDDVERGLADLAQLISGRNEVATSQKRYLKKDGSSLWASVTTTFIRLDNSTEQRRLVTALDITDKRHLDEMQKVTGELRRSNVELEQFAYIASHDLQEPLRMVSSCCSMLAKNLTNIDPQSREFLEYAVEGSLRMQALLRDLLSFSRAGLDDNTRIPTNAESCLLHCIANLRSTIERTQAIITHDPLPTVLAEPMMLAQVLQQLVSNALKFRAERPVRVHISAALVGTMWEFSIKDNGIGIDAQWIDKIFGLFQRLHNRDEYSGNGIGLALCRKIIQRLGGHIRVDSELGKGSTFYFSIPAIAQRVHQVAAVEPHMNEARETAK